MLSKMLFYIKESMSFELYILLLNIIHKFLIYM